MVLGNEPTEAGKVCRVVSRWQFRPQSNQSQKMTNKLQKAGRITWGFGAEAAILLHEEVTPQKNRGFRVGKNLISFLSPVQPLKEMDLIFQDLNRNQNLDRAKLGEGKRRVIMHCPEPEGHHLRIPKSFCTAKS